MRTRGRFEVDRNYPQAKGVCSRCGFIYTHRDLQWQFQFQGPKLQNIRLLVCTTCLDKPAEFLRTMILPADPLPILNPRPENYTIADNPVSPLGTSIGTMTGAGGLDAAFSMGFNKSITLCAVKSQSTAGFTNTVGRNWGTGLTQTMNQFSLYAPNDAPFLAVGTAYKVQGSNNGVVFTDIYSGTSAGTIGEIITVAISNSVPYQYHQVAFSGDGVSRVAIAQFVIESANQVQQGDE